jgi:hypothetical protein
LGHDENPIFEIALELNRDFPQHVLKSVIADIKDVKRISIAGARDKAVRSIINCRVVERLAGLSEVPPPICKFTLGICIGSAET